jgi:hypothetical protein
VGWDKGRYHTRSKKVNGRVVREYVGSGRVAELAARLDAIRREERLLARFERRMKRDELDEVDDKVQVLIDATDLLARAALTATGFRQHNRGEWRKPRVRRKTDVPSGPEDGGRDASRLEARTKG